MSEETKEERIKRLQEANKEAQGKKETSKKKIRYYTATEIVDEMKRLERGNHQQSKYYQQLVSRVA